MAAESGLTDSALAEPSTPSNLPARLLDRPFEFGLFQALRILHRAAGVRDPIGSFTPPGNEAVRLGTHVSLGFPPTEIRSLEFEPGSPPLMRISCFGLLGATGVLPTFYTELAVERILARDKTLATLELARFPRRDRLTTDHPERVDFAALFPDETFFPVPVFRQIMHRLLIHRDRASEVLQYSSPEGDPGLRAAIARELSRAGAPVSQDHIIVVNGTQQGIDLLLRLFVDPGDQFQQPAFAALTRLDRPAAVAAGQRPLFHIQPQPPLLLFGAVARVTRALQQRLNIANKINLPGLNRRFLARLRLLGQRCRST